ncbi:vWA domain-containing protein [Gaetbulibacter aestuarii]|uniref:VWA domain-containing protein n=1 Tax=Gaetbulibacter aestuarii TaxID=1502358 RepID=A0ABW7N1M4_9FLAO
MQFKHPELLYALFLLLIPIIIHLFQLRRFKKEQFTNVALLKKATLQTRKSSQIKKWLILATRLLALAALILAFAQPFTSPQSGAKKRVETVIYLDNSFSMQAQGTKGPLLKRAIQELVATIPEDSKISLITNNEIYRNTSIKAIKNDLLELDYTGSSLSTNEALLKAKTLFTNNSSSIKNLVFISDFQDNDNDFQFIEDKTLKLFPIQLQPESRNNIAIDSAFIEKENSGNLSLHVRLTDFDKSGNTVPISLFDQGNLIAKTAVEMNETSEAIFTLPDNQPIQGRLSIDDNSLQFDNTLYFNINKPPKINVLAINGASDSFLKRIYTPDEFNFSSTSESQLDYSLLDAQNLIVLNELQALPVALASALKSFLERGGALTIIPSNNTEIKSYNSFLTTYGLALNSFNNSEKRITKINYSHPLFRKGVFEKQVTNFQYPRVNEYYELSRSQGASALEFEDLKPFLIDSNKLFLLTAPLNEANSNFKNSPLIVPTFYNMAKYGLDIPSLYMIIGQPNRFDVKVKLGQDDILSMENKGHSYIPQQQYFNTKVRIQADNIPDIAGIYAIKNKEETLEYVSFNYDRSESRMNYIDISSLKGSFVSNSIEQIFDTIKSETKINALWKWFVIFAAALLIIEMAILKYFK